MFKKEPFQTYSSPTPDFSLFPYVTAKQEKAILDWRESVLFTSCVPAASRQGEQAPKG